MPIGEVYHVISAYRFPVMPSPRKILTVDVGGSSLKMLRSGKKKRRKVSSGPDMTARQAVAVVQEACERWSWDAVSIGYPSPVVGGRPLINPSNLGDGWVGFDYEAAFGCPVRIINDAAMQALGSYHGGRMLFLGLGTGLGSAMVDDGCLEPLELGHMPWRGGQTYEDVLGKAGLKCLGREAWVEAVHEVAAEFVSAISPDYIVLGGGNVKKLDELPPNCERGDNANAFIGGFRLWDPDYS